MCELSGSKYDEGGITKIDGSDKLEPGSKVLEKALAEVKKLRTVVYMD